MGQGECEIKTVLVFSDIWGKQLVRFVNMPALSRNPAFQALVADSILNLPKWSRRRLIPPPNSGIKWSK
jgi:hypothetical protein